MWLFFAGVVSAYVPAVLYIAYEAWRARKATRASRFTDALDDDGGPQSPVYNSPAPLLPRFGRVAADEPGAEVSCREQLARSAGDSPRRPRSGADS